MNSYHQQQFEALSLVRRHLASLPPPKMRELRSSVEVYLSFRDEVNTFLTANFSDVCTATCYRTQLSACCTREGIITFFADVVINALVSEESELDALEAVLQKPNTGFKCVYLGEQGCLWRVKPIVCEMYLCEPAKKQVFTEDPATAAFWEALKRREKSFKWPDRPVLFDDLERIFRDAGYDSSLMYLHNSPGLLRIKNQVKRSKKS